MKLAPFPFFNKGHLGRPLPFGSPVAAKFTQYDDIVSATWRSRSVQARLLRRLLNTYGISEVCTAVPRAPGANLPPLALA